MSFSSEQIESLIDSLIQLNLSGVNFDKSYLLKIDRQMSFFEISEKKFELHQSLISAAYSFGKNTIKTFMQFLF